MQAKDLVTLARAMERHGSLRMSTISTYAANDGKFLGSIERGAECTIRRASRVLQWFSDNWPGDLEWPSDIPRPAKRGSVQRHERGAA